MERWRNELYHYGIKGQKWGVRRYQNYDGTLTSAGRKRYSMAAPSHVVNSYTELSPAGKAMNKKLKNMPDDYIASQNITGRTSDDIRSTVRKVISDNGVANETARRLKGHIKRDADRSDVYERSGITPEEVYAKLKPSSAVLTTIHGRDMVELQFDYKYNPKHGLGVLIDANNPKMPSVVGVIDEAGFDMSST